MLHNKKAVVGETLTWIIATLIVIIILAFSIFVTSLLVKSQGFGGDRGFSTYNQNDLLVTKSLTGYLLTEDNGEKVFEQIKAEGDLNDFNGPLSLSIFLDLYKKDYARGWLDIRGRDFVLSAGSKRREYYEGYYETLSEEGYSYSFPTGCNAEERIYFDSISEDIENKNLAIQNLALCLKR